MENLVKTTTLRFNSAKNGFRANVTVTKDSEGNITVVNLNSIEQNGNTWLGDLTLNASATTQILGIAALVDQVLTEAENEGNNEPINDNSNED